MKAITLLAVFTLVGIFSTNVKSGELAEVNARIDAIVAKTKTMKQEIDIRLTDQIATFPEYQSSLETFLKSAQTSLDEMENSMNSIKGMVSKELSQLYSKEKALNDKLSKIPSDRDNQKRAMKKTIKLYQDRIRESKRNLSKLANESYKLAIHNVIVANKQLQIPYAVRKLESDNGYGKRHYVVDQTYYKFYEADDTTVSSSSRGYAKSLLRDQKNYVGKQIFSGCKTSGCVFHLLEEIKDYSESIFSLNQDIELVEGLTLRGIEELPEVWAVNQLLSKIAKQRASELPIAIFNEQ